jgi:putative redox protein
MVAIEIVYQGQLHCQATHTPSGAVIETDAPKDNMGKGESFSPTDLVATALGSCILTVMGIAARKMNIDLSGMSVMVHKEMVASPVRRIGKLMANINFPMQVIEEHKEKLQEIAFTCPVHQSLHPDVAMPMTFTWA